MNPDLRHWATRWRRVLRSILRRQAVDDELREELEFFIDRRTAEQVAAGVSPDEAARSAKRAVGSVAWIRDACHDVRGTRAIDAVIDDSRSALRLLRRHAGFAVVTVMLTAMSIGVAATAVALLDAILLRALPAITRPDELALVSGVGPNNDRRGQSLPMYELISQQREGTAQIFAYRNYGGLPAMIRGTTIPVRGIGVIGDYFAALPDIPLLRGHTFDPNSDEPNALISSRLWQEDFGGANEVVGRTLTMGPVTFTVVGVVGPEFLGLQPDLRWDVIAPFTVLNRARGLQPPAIRNQIVYTTVRLKRGVTTTQYAARLATIWPNLLEQTVPASTTLEDWRTQRGPRVVVESVRSGQSFTLITNPGLPRALELTASLAVMIFLASCLTLALLVVARAVRQQRDTAIRLALGGDRWRVVRPYVVEGLCLAGVGCVAGLFFASWAIVYSAQYVPGDWALSIMPWGVASGILMALLTVALGTGLAAYLASRGSVRTVMQRASRSTQPHVRLRTVLLTLQVVASVVLIYAALLYGDDLRRLLRVPIGMRVDNLNVYELVGTLPYRTLDAEYFQRLLSALENTPGVESVGLSVGAPPLSYLRDFTEPVETTDGPRTSAYVTCIFPGVLSTWGTPQLSGRDLQWTDGPAVLLTESLARRMFDNGEPLGHTVRTLSPKPTEYQVVGVVGNMAFNGPRLGTRDVAFVPCLERMKPLPSNAIVDVFMRSSTRTQAELKGEVATVVERLGAQFVYYDGDQASIAESAVQQERMLATVSGTFGGIVIFLTTVALSAFASYMLTFRTRELAIRAALGAGPASVVLTGLRELLVVFGSGLAVGLVVSVVLHRGLLGVVGDLGPVAWQTPMRVTAILGAALVLAAAVPAFRAARVELASALRLDE